jgi:hypothetical protein
MKSGWLIDGRPLFWELISAIRTAAEKMLLASPRTSAPRWREAILEGILILAEMGIRRHCAANQSAEATYQNLLSHITGGDHKPAGSVLKRRTR